MCCDQNSTFYVAMLTDNIVISNMSNMSFDAMFVLVQLYVHILRNHNGHSVVLFCSLFNAACM